MLLVSAAFLAVSFVVYFQLFQDSEHNERMVAWLHQNGTGSIWNEVLPQIYNIPSENKNTQKPSHTKQDPINEKHHNTSNPILQVPLLVDNLFDVQNETLGVQEVFLVSLDTRRDKHDAFAVQAMASNIRYTPVEGVIGDQVPKKALPYKMELLPAEIGCWRAHMNIFEKIIERRIATAIIFEDDADWDVSFKQQLVQYARGTRYITSSEANGSFVPHSPYGEDWDVLWIGDCSTKDWPGDNKRFVIPNDPTVLPLEFRKENERPEMRYWDRAGSDYKTRIIYRAKTASCTAGYAISLKGAQKAIYYLSMSPNDQPIDNGMGRLCGDEDKNFRCMTANPTLVGISKPAGSTNRGSDVGHVPSESHDEGVAHSERVMYSTRMNLPSLLAGKTMMKSEHPEHSPDMELSQIGSAIGHPYVLTQEEIDELVNFDAEIKQKEESDRLQEAKKTLDEERQKLRDAENKLKTDEMKIAAELRQTEEKSKVDESGRGATSTEVPEDFVADSPPMPTVADAGNNTVHDTHPYESNEVAQQPDYGSVEAMDNIAADEHYNDAED